MALRLLSALACLLAVSAVEIYPTENAPTVRGRSLLVNTIPSPTTPPKTVPFDNNLQGNSPDLASTDPRVAKKGLGCDTPNQVHLTFWSPTAVLVSWVTCDAQIGAGVNGRLTTPASTSLQYWRHCDKRKASSPYYPKYVDAMAADASEEAVGAAAAEPSSDSVDADLSKYKHYKHHNKHQDKDHYKREDTYKREDKSYKGYGKEDKHYKSYDKDDEGYEDKECKPQTVAGTTTSYWLNYTAVYPANNYASGIIHHVLLKGLTPGHKYYYKVSGAKDSRVFSFAVPAPKFPLRLGVVADPGLTSNTSVVLDRLVKEKPQLLALIGDFCYADAWTNETLRSISSWLTYQPKWDQWGNLFEPLLSKVPFLHVNGNHEIEREGGTSLTTGVETARMRSYNNRYPVPQTSDQRMNGPTDFSPVTAANLYRNLYFVSEVPGVFTSFSLTSYSPGQNMTTLEQQYVWLQAELAKIDRSKTPWLLVNWHAPWYNTYNSHFKEMQAMRATYEALLVQYKVDIVFNGHVHAYERKTPINNNMVSTDGPVSFTIGDGGNVEGMYKEFVDVPTYTASWNKTCLNNGSAYTFPSYQPAPPNYKYYEPTGQWCPGNTPGCWCYGTQPSWSAFREPSFGYGILTFQSPTEATWTWHKNQAPAFEVGDQVKIIRSA